ncbi:hypothetical protein ABZP36_020897 [Zizania latifolia]
MCLPFLCGGDDHGRPRESSPVVPSYPQKEANEGHGHTPLHANGNGYDAPAGTNSDDVPSRDPRGQKEDPPGKTDPMAHPEQARAVGDVAGAGAHLNGSVAPAEQTNEARKPRLLLR